jgi:hypothetical protein
MATQVPPTSIHSTPAAPAAPSNGNAAGVGAAAAPYPVPPGGRLVRMIVVLCFAITIVATALIYWRWANVTVPSSYIIVQGGEEHVGTVVVVSSEHHPDAMATITPDNHYAATIFLHPGPYTLKATLNGETLVHGNMLVVHRRWKAIMLPSRKAAAAAGHPAGVS